MDSPIESQKEKMLELKKKYGVCDHNAPFMAYYMDKDTTKAPSGIQCTRCDYALYGGQFYSFLHEIQQVTGRDYNTQVKTEFIKNEQSTTSKPKDNEVTPNGKEND